MVYMECKINQSIYIVLLLTIFFFSCKAPVDAGYKVDAKAPVVRITYPQEECPVIRNSFKLKGVVKDGSKIEKVTVSLSPYSDKGDANEMIIEKKVFTCLLEQKENTCEWTATLNMPNKDGSFPLKDGKYTVNIVAVSKSGKEGVATYSFVVDNTPPLLFLHGNHCKTIKDYNDRLVLGADLSLKGIVFDECASCELEFFVYDKGNWQKTTLGRLHDGFDVKVDGFFSAGTNKGLYKNLYGDVLGAGEKAFRYVIQISDLAKEYESPTSNGRENIGNRSLDFYFYAPLDNTLYKEENKSGKKLFPKYSVKDIYEMFSSRYYTDKKGVVDEDRKKESEGVLNFLAKGKTEDGLSFKFSPSLEIKQWLEGTSNAKVKGSGTDVVNGGGALAISETRLGSLPVLTLNPLNSPRFEVLGMLPIEIDLSKASKGVSVKTLKKAGDVLQMRLTSSSTYVELQDPSGFEFYYYPLSKFLKYYEKNSCVLDLYHAVSGQKSSGQKSIDQNADINIDLKAMLELIKIENVAIKKEGASFLATFSIDEVQKEEVKEGALKRGESYLIVVKGRDVNGNPFIPLYSNDDVVAQHKYYAFRIEGEALEEDPSKKTELLSDVDNDKGSWISIDHVPQLVKVFPQVKGSILGKGVDRNLFVQASYNNGKRFDVPIEWLDNARNGEWKLGKFANEKEGFYQLFFREKDKEDADKSQRVLKVYLDKEEPVLLGINDFSIEGIEAGKRLEIKYFQDIRNVSIGGEIKETDGIADVKIGLKNYFDETNDKTFKSLSVKQVSGNEGKYSFLTSFDFKKEGSDVLILKIVDIAGRSSIYEVPFLLDKSAPNFRKVQLGTQTFTNLLLKKEKLEKNTCTSSSKHLRFYCEANDDGSGVAKLEVYNGKVAQNNLITSLLPTAKGDGAKSVVVAFQSAIDLPSDKNQLIFCLYDNASYMTEWQCEVTIPKLTSVNSEDLASEQENIYLEDVDDSKQNSQTKNIACDFLPDGIFYSIMPMFPSSQESEDAKKVTFLVKDNMMIATHNKKLISLRATLKSGEKLISGKLTISSSKKPSKVYLARIEKMQDKQDFYTLDFNKVDIALSGEGVASLEFEVKTSSNLRRRERRNVVLDFTPPTIEVIPSKIYTGSARIRGKLFDQGSSSVAEKISGVDETSLEYKIGNTPFMKEHSIDGEVLSRLRNNSSSWKIDIPNIEKYVIDDEGKYGAKKIGENIWSLPLQIRVKDKAGNEKTSDIYEIRFKMKK